MRNLSRMIDNLQAGFIHIRMNTRNIFIASIGLLLALAIISSTIIFVDTQKVILLENDFDELKSWKIINEVDGNDQINPFLFKSVINQSFEDNFLIHTIQKIITYTHFQKSFILSNPESIDYNFNNLTLMVYEFPNID